jgi:MtN3 and saliva related transmembrane protein
LLSVEWLGLIAGAITTASFLPQVIRIFRLKSAHEISMTFTILFLIGLSCWIAYGIFLQRLSLIMWNSISSLLALTLIYAKLKYGR